MEIDAGNPLEVTKVVSAGKDGKDIAVPDLEKSAVEIKDENMRQADGDDEAEPALPLSKARLIALVVTLTGAGFLNTLSAQAAVIVLPTIGRDLDIPEERQQWIVSAYSLTFGCFLLLWGRLADVYGKRLIFIWGSAWVTALTIAVPFAPNEISFDVLRGLQGLGAAANVPTALGILGVTFPPGKAKNYAFTFYSAGAPMGSIFGNLLGGVVAQYASWKWIFWILAIIAAIVTVAGHFVIPLPTATSVSTTSLKSSVDWVGATLITTGLLALMFALTEGNVVGWSTPYIPALIVVSVLLTAAFVFWCYHLEKKGERPPLMKVSIWRNTQFSAAMVIMFLFFASFNNFLVYATYFFQDFQGLSVIQTTLRFIPTGVVGCLTAFTTAHLLSLVRGNYILMFSNLCVALSSLLFAVPIYPYTTYWAVGFPAMCLAVFGGDTLYPSLQLFTSHSLPLADQALGGALINAVGQLGRAVGLGIATAVETAVRDAASGGQERVKKGNDAYLKGLRAANWTSAALGFAAMVVVAGAFRGAGKLGKMKR